METFSSSPDKLVKEDNKPSNFLRKRRNLIILLSLTLIAIIVIIVILVSII